MYLVAGLGNPGIKYRNTRHNVGFKVINLWAKSLGIRLSGRRFGSRNTRTTFQAKPVILLRPLTYMNQSGKSIRACVDFFDLGTEKILVIHDDIDLPVGKIRIVRGGGAGGHKGVLSIMQHLGAREFPRLKIGVGRPQYSGESVEDYVLRPFYRDEKKIIEDVIKMAVRACELFIADGIDTTMNRINNQNLTKLRR
ncbi:MAG: aminoacyl-tRNA hydrolase [Deltaproteobacteria bacterium]|nr:MAG: aminoacyl-tRNA hydrolase [Deltaproteobacteria bacterium]